MAAKEAGAAAAAAAGAGEASTDGLSLAKKLDGKAMAATVRGEVAAEVAEMVKAGKRAPGLAVVLVGARTDSATYVRMKKKALAEVGMVAIDHHKPEDVTEEELVKLVADLNKDPIVDGILVQLPLPGHINEERVLGEISIEKDVDGFHPLNIGKVGRGFFCVDGAGLGVRELAVQSSRPRGKDETKCSLVL